MSRKSKNHRFSQKFWKLEFLGRILGPKLCNMIFHDFSTILTCWRKLHGFGPKCRNGVLWPQGKIRNRSILGFGQNPFGVILDTSKALRRNFFKFQNFEKMMVLVIFRFLVVVTLKEGFFGYQNFEKSKSTEKGFFEEKI